MAANGSGSKKRSDASSKSKRLEPVVFFLDRSLGRKKVVAALMQAGAHAEVHDAHFPINARDEDWLREVGRRGWIVLTKDKKIRHRATELAALYRAGVSAFVLTSGNLSGDGMAAAFARALPRMVRTVQQSSSPFIGTVTKDGSVSVLR